MNENGLRNLGEEGKGFSGGQLQRLAIARSLYQKRDLELTKNDLLTNIWGVTERINTHTLETHLYRLKQKLFKLEPNLSFSLINKNGLYYLKYN